MRTATNSSAGCNRLGWTFLVHHTDRPASEPLLSLVMRLQAQAGDYRLISPPSAATEPLLPE